MRCGSSDRDLQKWVTHRDAFHISDLCESRVLIRETSPSRRIRLLYNCSPPDGTRFKTSSEGRKSKSGRARERTSAHVRFLIRFTRRFVRMWTSYAASGLSEFQ